MKVRLFLCTDHAAALLAAVQPGCSTAVECASALVQTLTAGPVVTGGTAEQILVWVFAVTGSPPAVRLPILNSGDSGQGANRLTAGQDSIADVQREGVNKDLNLVCYFCKGGKWDNMRSAAAITKAFIHQGTVKSLRFP